MILGTSRPKSPRVDSEGGYPQCKRCQEKEQRCIWPLHVIMDRMAGVTSKRKSCVLCSEAKAPCTLPKSKPPARTSSKRPIEEDEPVPGPSKRPKRKRRSTGGPQQESRERVEFQDVVLNEVLRISACLNDIKAKLEEMDSKLEELIDAQ